MKFETVLKNHPYGREADEVVALIADPSTVPASKRYAVAQWLREYVAARAYGCTGLTTAPDGPTIAADGSTEDPEDERPEDHHRDAREPRTAYDPGAGPFPHGYGNP
jgi:hypothetical protein